MIKAGRDLQHLYLLKALAKKHSNQILVRFLDDEKNCLNKDVLW